MSFILQNHHIGAHPSLVADFITEGPAATSVYKIIYLYCLYEMIPNLFMEEYLEWYQIINVRSIKLSDDTRLSFTLQKHHI